MGLTFTKTEEGHLRIAADQEMQAELIQMRSENPDKFGTDSNLYEVFEGLTSNSELSWISPETIGALTDAPILGIFGDEYPIDGVDMSDPRVVGRYPDDKGNLRHWVQDVEEAWGFMDYALRSPLEDLANKGYVIFMSGK